jgi:hypothetical protein
MRASPPAPGAHPVQDDLRQFLPLKRSLPLLRVKAGVMRNRSPTAARRPERERAPIRWRRLHSPERGSGGVSRLADPAQRAASQTKVGVDAGGSAGAHTRLLSPLQHLRWCLREDLSGLDWDWTAPPPIRRRPRRTGERLSHSPKARAPDVDHEDARLSSGGVPSGLRPGWLTPRPGAVAPGHDARS